MRNINLFVEDVAHEDFLTALIQRFADAYIVEVNIKASSVRGGRGTVITELKQYLRDLQHNKEDLPDPLSLEQIAIARDFQNEKRRLIR